MTDPESRSFMLPSGRRLAFAEYGAPDGLPLLYFHGAPGSRLPLPEHPRIAREEGVRVVAPDRPGYGGSDPHPGRSLLDWADDVARLADHLSLHRFGVAGKSAGAPHAAACAWRLRDRVRVLGFVSGPAPPATPGLEGALSEGAVAIGEIGERAPSLLDAGTAAAAATVEHAPKLYVHLLASRLGAPDRRILEQPTHRRALLREYREAYRQGSHAQAQDLALVSQPWGFDVQAIEARTSVWNGREDRLIPPRVAELMARELPGADLRLVADAGHLMLETPEHWRGILRSLTGGSTSGDQSARTAGVAGTGGTRDG